ncbi:3-oxoacyl-[acyl-carrier-protein] reductase [Dehalogenimonas alkenigignens]|uniref:3-oxoacyl-[acyl-carrier-protein] reductase n=1 Tax=Dehalogenimonas alkenigignens TaxID=1217799 RepID=A0A0W0GHY2_9CHLR|nr:3-oxoacyl-[acyl-carrier-protein] reductase [Dehalogenimonas alkenigignens]KTB48186.1 3-oxoacyl-[acyl-carrier-protein] reductase [Dehalogenimonas alkenigignens]PVV84426.1 3-oxoacyl-[acyl-carrier-protein] reductase [Dehalogenimonas alkenigignens]
MELRRLEGKVAVVTGAGRGIGAAIARRFSVEGASLVLNSLSDSAFRIADEINAAGGRAVAVQGNVSVAAEAVRVIETAGASFGRLDILINNAGITRDGLLLRMSEEDWDAVLDTNLKSVYLCCRAALRPMLKSRGGGRIINLSSVIGLSGNAGQANYAASKAGIIGFTKSLAKELASRQVTVNAIAPGFIVTDMTAGLTGEAKEALLARIPLGSLGAAEDIAAAAAYLASEEARYITGQTLTVDGGMTL